MMNACMMINNSYYQPPYWEIKTFTNTADIREPIVLNNESSYHITISIFTYGVTEFMEFILNFKNGGSIQQIFSYKLNLINPKITDLDKCEFILLKEGTSNHYSDGEIIGVYSIFEIKEDN